METEDLEPKVADVNGLPNYECVVVPSSMRSLYWKYFGFPADISNNILTRKKIVCVLCSGVITYNKNTTNLRTHLVAKHSEILVQLNDERKRCIKPTKRNATTTTTTITELQVPDKRIKLQPISSDINERSQLGNDTKSTVTIIHHQGDVIHDDDDGDNKRKMNNLHLKLSANDGVASLIEALQDDAEMNDDVREEDEVDDGGDSRMIEAKLESFGDDVDDGNVTAIVDEVTEPTETEFIDTNEFQTYQVALNPLQSQVVAQHSHHQQQQTNYRITTEGPNEMEVKKVKSEKYTIINSSNQQNISTNKIIKLTEMIIADLLPTCLVDGKGFQKFTNVLNQNYIMPRKLDIECRIRKMYEEKFLKIHEMIKEHCNQQQFSLSMEIWRNIESKTLLSIYFNYLPQSQAPNLWNIFYKTTELRQQTNVKDLEKLFDGINMKNCSAAVVNESTAIVREFLLQHGIPTVMCFNTVINSCIEKIFELPEVDDIFLKICEHIEVNPDNVEEFVSLDYLNEIPCTKMNLVNVFYDNVPWKDEINDFLIKVKSVKHTLQPLRSTLETLTDEPIALCSLVKPFTMQLLNEHFNPCKDDNEMVLEMKNIIVEELKRYILSNELYAVTAFFDPRFQIFINPNEIQQIKNNLCEQLEIDANSDAQKDDKLNKHLLRDENSTNSRRSSLKQFFNRSTDRSSNIKNNNIKNRFDTEITKYVRHANNVDLEQCPLKWWMEYGYIYRNLKKLPKKYFCIPSCYNNMFRLNIMEQIQFANRRYQLKGKLINYLWFLHYNK